MLYSVVSKFVVFTLLGADLVNAGSPPATILKCINIKASECLGKHADYQCICDDKQAILECLAIYAPYGNYLEARDHFLGSCIDRFPHLIDDPDYNMKLPKKRLTSTINSEIMTSTTIKFTSTTWDPTTTIVDPIVSSIPSLLPGDDECEDEDNENELEDDDEDCECKCYCDCDDDEYDEIDDDDGNDHDKDDDKEEEEDEEDDDCDDKEDKEKGEEVDDDDEEDDDNEEEIDNDPQLEDPEDEEDGDDEDDGDKNKEEDEEDKEEGDDEDDNDDEDDEDNEEEEEEEEFINDDGCICTCKCKCNKKKTNNPFNDNENDSADDNTTEESKLFTDDDFWVCNNPNGCYEENDDEDETEIVEYLAYKKEYLSLPNQYQYGDLEQSEFWSEEKKARADILNQIQELRNQKDEKKLENSKVNSKQNSKSNAIDFKFATPELMFNQQKKKRDEGLIDDTPYNVKSLSYRKSKKKNEEDSRIRFGSNFFRTKKLPKATVKEEDR